MDSRAGGNGTHFDSMSRGRLQATRCAKCQAVLRDYQGVSKFKTNGGHIVLEETIKAFGHNVCDHCGFEMPMGTAVCPECGKDPNSG